MAAQDLDKSLERQITEWRAYLRRRQAIEAVDVAELEDHLREQIAVLMDAGLDADEAFLVAVKRMGELDALSREFAREHSERLWKQLVLPSVHTVEAGNRARTEALTVVGLAVGAALAVKLPELFRITLDGNPGFYARNLSLFAFPFLIAYFLWKRGVAKALLPREVAALVAAVLLANAYPYTPGGHTELLVAIHLPIALWLMVGRAYAASRWNDGAGRMDFVRFSGELVIYYALIALGGGVLSALTALTFRSIGLDIEDFLTTWLLPCGAMGAVIVGAWLVEAKQSVIENMAPVLARLFTPLFAAVLVTFLVTLIWTGRGIDIERGVLIAFDLLLAVVLGLLLYSVSARDPASPPGLFDWLQVFLVVSALLVDAVALTAIAGRISEFGWSPNRVAALGENVVLLVNLAWSAVLYIRFLRGRGPFADLERWHTDYLPVYAWWGAFVVVVFPPVFGFI